MLRWLSFCALLACRSREPATKEELGRLLFHDPALSEPAGQACADCHGDRTAFSDIEDERTSIGVIRDRIGFRNAQTVMYAAYAPRLHADNGRYIGGLFWDGRADTLEAQIEGPLLNPLEMNNPSKRAVVDKVERAYGKAFRTLFGADAFADVDAAFAHIGEAIAAYERTPVFAPFNSRYDRYLAGTDLLSSQELRGLAIFEDPNRGNCAACHPSRGSAGKPPLFTNHSYANLGLPKWDNSLFYVLPKELNPAGTEFIDHGLMSTVHDPRYDGMFRVPTLRNVARTSPYSHNGYFRSLNEMVRFLSARDLTCTTGSPRDCPRAEVPATMDLRVGRLGLTDAEIDDVVAFLGTLSDDAP